MKHFSEKAIFEMRFDCRVGRHGDSGKVVRLSMVRTVSSMRTIRRWMMKAGFCFVLFVSYTPRIPSQALEKTVVLVRFT